MQSGLFYLLSSNDFEKNFVKVDEQVAKYEPQKSNLAAGSSKEVDQTKGRKGAREYYKERNKFKRSVRQIIRGYKKRSLV